MHTFVNALYHCVFSTKDRLPLIDREIRPRLEPYLAGIARAEKMRLLGVGGVADHMHLLLSLPAPLPLAKAMQLLKGNSSKWINDTFPRPLRFAWQEGYGAFTIGTSQAEATLAYFARQEAHHARKSFRDEIIEMLNRHGMTWEDRDLP